MKAQAQSLISYTYLNHESAYIGQPVQLTVSVYTNTWFTSGVDVGNIQVENALTVYFRSVSNTRTFSGKNYSGVDFIYNLFPTKAGQITIPELTIHVESPKPGGYQGIKHIVKTKPKTLMVSDIPIGFDPKNWLVSSSLNISQHWNTSIEKVKVGDVLQRTITRSVGGTLSEFIPETVWDTVSGVSLYPTRPKVETFKSKTYVSSKRSETVNYLFEKEGLVVLPKIEYIYWNYNTKKSYKKVLDSTVIMVAPNADLEMLATIKKQLEQEQKQSQVQEEKSFLILGMTPKRFLVIVILGLLGVYILVKLVGWSILFLKKTYQTYIHSETYLFTKVKKALRQNNSKKFIEQLTIWMLHLDIEEKSFDYFLKHYGTEQLKQEYSELMVQVYKTNAQFINNSSTLLKALKLSRKQYFIRLKDNKQVKLDTDWLNPTS